MIYRFERFAGLDQSADELLTNQRFASDARNVEVSDGSLKSAAGYARYADAALAGGITALAAFYPRVNGVTVPRLIAANAGGVYEWAEGAWTARYTGVGSGYVSAQNYQYDGADVLLLADPARDTLLWDGGASMTALTGCPADFSHVALHAERIWGAGAAGEPDAVYWSRAFDPTDWTGDEENADAGGGVVLIPSWNGGRVVALREQFGDVLVFKDDDLYRVVGTYPGDYEVVRVHGVNGPVAGGAIASSANACYFLSRDGLCVYDGVSAKPTGDRRAKGFFARVNPAAASLACAAVFKNVLYLAAPVDGATANNAVLELDLDTGSYCEIDGVAANCLMEYGDALLFAGADGRVYRYGSGATRDGAAFEAWWRTPWIDLDKPGEEKYAQSLSLFAEGELEVLFETDRHSIRRHVNTHGRDMPVTVRLGGHGRRFRMTIRSVGGSSFRVRAGMQLTLDDNV